jgi:hypothetical protein
MPVGRTRKLNAKGDMISLFSFWTERDRFAAFLIGPYLALF